MKKIISVLSISIIVLLSSFPHALAGTDTEKYPEGTAFQNVFGVSAIEDVTKAEIVYSDGRSAEMDIEDAKQLLETHWNFYMERFTMPQIKTQNTDYYFNFFTKDGEQRTLTSSSFILCAGFGENNYIWYRPYIGNARNALYTAVSAMNEKYRDLAAASDKSPFIPEENELENRLDASLWAIPEIRTAASFNILPFDLTTQYMNPVSRENFCRIAGYMICRMQNPSGGTHPYNISGDLMNFLLEREVDTQSQVSFPDYEYPGFEVSALYRLGVISGRDDSTFDPDGTITREEAAKILYNCAGLFTRTEPAAASFADDEAISPWAKEYVYWVSQNRIMNGMEDGRFAPREAYKTEQSIATILRLFKQIMPENNVLYVAAKWAEAMKMRDGKAQFALMSENLKAQFEDAGWVTGVSSPWIERYEVRTGKNEGIKIGDNEAVVIFEYATSTGYAGTYEHTLTFVSENGQYRIDHISEAYDKSGRQ